MKKLRFKIEIKTIVSDSDKIAEIISDKEIISNAEDGKDLMGNIYFQGFDKLLIYEKNISPEFFDLKNGIAGEILQKFSNYRVRLAIIGNFKNYTKKSVTDFILESNKGGHINFVSSKDNGIKRLFTK